MLRSVTENDFRKDEFKNKNPEDYEFRDDGAILRKDRWKMGMITIASIVKSGDFEIEDIIEIVRKHKIHYYKDIDDDNCA